MQVYSSQSLSESASDEEEATESDEGVTTPAPHEPSAEVRKTSSEAGSRFFVRQGGGEMGRTTVSIELDRAQS